jgi:hypothetical protein
VKACADLKLFPVMGKPAAALAAALILGGCIMGGGSDQPNKSGNMLGKVRGGDGQSEAMARVSLYRGTYLPGYDAAIAPSKAELVADSASNGKGQFGFADPGAGSYFLEAISRDSGAIAVSNAVEHTGHEQILPDLKLTDAAALEGTMASASPILSLHLAGTHFQAPVDSSGRFRFGPLPYGDYWLIARLGGSGGETFEPVRAIHLDAGAPLSLPGLRVEKNRIPLFDFESTEGYSALRGLTYPFAQAAGSPVGAWKPLPLATDTAGAYRGKSYHALLNVGEEIGFAIGNGYYDLGKMTSFSFHAKGKGRIEVLFYSSLISPVDVSLRATIALDTAWTKIDILPESIISPPGSISEQKGYTWAKAKNKASKITFQPKDSTAEIWLDDLSLEGMDFRDLGPAFPAGPDAFP